MIKKTTAILTAALMLGQSAYAACEINVKNSEVTLNISEFNGYSEVMVRVFRDGKSGSDLYNTDNMMDVIAYQTQVTTDKSGNAKVTFYLDASGNYTVELGEMGKSTVERYALEEYADVNFSKNLIADINTAIGNADVDSVKGKIEANYEKLSLDAVLYEEVSSSGGDLRKIYSMVAKGDTVTGVVSLEKALNTSAMLVKMENMTKEDAKLYFEKNVSLTFFAESGMYKIYNEFMTNGTKLEIISQLQSAEKKSCTDVVEKHTEIAAVYSLNNALGAQTSKGVLKACEAELGINLTKCETLKNPSAVYLALCGVGVTNFEDIASKFEAAYNTQKNLESEYTPTTGSPGSSGGSGGSGSGIIVRDPATTNSTDTVIKETQTNAKNEIFTDLGGYDWAKESIYKLYSDNIISGRGNGKFAPGEAVTREEFVKIITTALKIYNANAKCEFFDVAPGAWYESYVASAVNNGIIQGITPEMFGTGKNITRQDVAVIIYRAMNVGEAEMGLDIKDSDKISDYAKNAVEKMYELGILTGDETGNFNPLNNTTRAEAAVIINRMINKL